MKESFKERADIPRKIEKIEFGLFSSEEMRRLSHLHVVNRELYQAPDRQPMPYGVLDRRLGTCDKATRCETCGQKLADCVGHFGHIKLELPVFHVGFFKAIITLLQNICRSCSRLLLPEDERPYYLSKMRNPAMETLARRSLLKKLNEKCRRTQACPYCDAVCGSVKKAGVFKVVDEVYKRKKKSGVSAKDDDTAAAMALAAAAEELMDGDGGADGGDEMIALAELDSGWSREARTFHGLFSRAARENKDVEKNLHKAQVDLNPLVVLALFERVTAEDCEIMDMDPVRGRPERLLFTCMLVPPVCIRPSVAMDAAAGSNEDDLTMKLAEINLMNSEIRKKLESGNLQTVVEDWDYLQLQCAMYINSDNIGQPPSTRGMSKKGGKPIRGFCQRLKGKTGRFRGNLSGKRVDFSSRTVISPDPNLAINQVAVPLDVAKILTYPARVFTHNIEELRAAVRNGPATHPGANYVEYTGKGMKRSLKYGNRDEAAAELQVGDVVERHMQDGDPVLFNRQPSLHKMSIMCHFAKVRPDRTFRFNECVCGPYNADFDGDEMNLHLPQTEEARAEALVLMGVNANMVTPRNGEPLVAATQDFITASYILTRRDVFLDRAQFMQAICYFNDATLHVDLPPPCIVKPVQLWTGKQVISVLLRPNRASPVLVNVRVEGKSYSKRGEEMCANDGFVHVRNSELISGTLDKASIGSGSKNTLFFVLLRDYGDTVASDRMSKLARLCARWLGNQGFSIGIGDVEPSTNLGREKERLVSTGYSECDNYIAQFQRGELTAQAGCTAEETLEAVITGELSAIRSDAGQMCLTELDKRNAPLIMALCGSKGSNINISQMIACVGQQTVSGTRIPNGFEERTLPHFGRRSKIPAAKGFVKNSFYSGLTPTEFFFHTMGGREGLVDTAVKTAETGYMQRRLMKALEDLSTQYDDTVRNSVQGIVQLCYGDDRLDPARMEGKDQPVDFQRVLLDIKARLPDREAPSLLPKMIRRRTREMVRSAEWRPTSEKFRETVVCFLDDEADRLASTRRTCGVPADRKEADCVAERMVDKCRRVTRVQLKRFLSVCLQKYSAALVEPGTAVGAIGAQSIGEPGTQMTLKTFHFAGVASMNITLGVPRIKEIINASKSISTPIITAALDNPSDVKVARLVKGRIEKTTLGDVCKYIKEVYERSACYLVVHLDQEVIEQLQLEITVKDVVQALVAASKLKLKEAHLVRRSEWVLHVSPPLEAKKKKTTASGARKKAQSIYYLMQSLRQALPKVIVKGIATISRAVINMEGNKEQYNLMVEGYNLREVMATEGVAGVKARSNHIVEMETTLGIEAARVTIMNEIQYTMSQHGMNIDARHVMLLADLMTYKGLILGITRFGIAKLKDSQVLMLASFEKTTDHLFEAALHGRKDALSGVSECIIMGITMDIGTGLFTLLHRPPLPSAVAPALDIDGAAAAVAAAAAATDDDDKMDVDADADAGDGDGAVAARAGGEGKGKRPANVPVVGARPLVFDRPDWHPSIFVERAQ